MRLLKVNQGVVCRIGFTLIELLGVIAIIALLAAMLLPALSRAKAQARSIECKNHLRQMDLALQMYVDNNNDKYPYTYVSGSSFMGMASWWAIAIAPYYASGWWTNRAYQCPGYKGPLVTNVEETLSLLDPLSYAYNMAGTSLLIAWVPIEHLGLGPAWATGMKSSTAPDSIMFPTTSESAVVAPSEMFAFSDSQVLAGERAGVI